VSRVVVIGGGISGLVTALGVAERSGGAVEVELREALDRVGGALRASQFAGRRAIDEGADSFLARVPHARLLAGRLGLDLTAPEPVTPAVWHGRLHDIPSALLLGVPGEIGAIARSRLLSARGKLRAAAEPLLPRRDPGDSIGRLIRQRFGTEVHERLVDALVGSIYAADTDRFSLAMVPQLEALAKSGRSLLLGVRRARATAPDAPGPVFLAPLGGMAGLARATADAARRLGVAVRAGAPVAQVAQDGTAWRVDGDRAEVVVLANPAARAAATVAGTLPALAAELASMEHAGVAVVTLAVGDWPARLHGRSGYLVPKDVQRTVTAVSFGSQKWAHWRGPDQVVRVSLGRDGLPVDHLGDEELVERAVAEVGRHVGVDLQPRAVRVSRWPGAFPQYRPGHRGWLHRVDAATPPGLFLVGASYRGIGVPACVADAERASAAIAERLRVR
jgi:oxygen-dependent protoporphyrinogen oxidase